VTFTAFLKTENSDQIQNVLHVALSAGVADPAGQCETLGAGLQSSLHKMETSPKAKLTKHP